MWGTPEGGWVCTGVGDGGVVDGLAAGLDEGEGDRDGEVPGEADGEWFAASGERADGECELDELFDGVPRGDPEPIGEASVPDDELVATEPEV